MTLMAAFVVIHLLCLAGLLQASRRSVIRLDGTARDPQPRWEERRLPAGASGRETVR